MKNFKNQRQLKIAAFILAVMLIAASALFMFSCSKSDGGKDNADTSSTQLGEGKKSFTLEITAGDGDKRTYTIKTDESNVGDALIKDKLVPEDSKNSKLITTLDGVTPNWDNDQTYWSYFINGEYAMIGAFETDISDGDAYSFVFDKYIPEETT